MSEENATRNTLCARMEAHLLTAELSELRGQGESELAMHVVSCVRCRAAAQRILLGNALLSERIDIGLARKRNGSSAWPLWLALPIAAALAALMVIRTEHLERSRVSAQAAAAPTEEMRRPVESPVVNVPANRNVAVFKAAENITVVWDLGSKEGS